MWLLLPFPCHTPDEQLSATIFFLLMNSKPQPPLPSLIMQRTPVVGGQELDLWVLYKQVVAAGGLASVVHKKKWAEVCAIFNFPSTFTSRSYTMRKLYSQILW